MSRRRSRKLRHREGPHCDGGEPERGRNEGVRGSTIRDTEKDGTQSKCAAVGGSVGALSSKASGMRAEKRRHAGGREGDLRVLGLMAAKSAPFGSHSPRWGLLAAPRGSVCSMMGEETPPHVPALPLTGASVPQFPHLYRGLPGPAAVLWDAQPQSSPRRPPGNSS